MSLKDYSLKPEDSGNNKGKRLGSLVSDGVIDNLTQTELLDLRDKIDGKLTGINIKDVNLSQELLFQLKRAKELQSDDSNEEGAPLNQRVQAQNSAASVIVALIKIQDKAYTSERFKRMESAVIKVVKTLPTEQQESFFKSYMSEAEIEQLS